MLKCFKVKNFMGFKDEIVLDLSARTYAFNEDLIRNKIVDKGLIYGKNGTGKTNLGLAIMDIVSVLSDNSKGQLLVNPNYKNLDSYSPVANFEYEFLLKGKSIVYRYAKKTPAEIVYEELEVDGETVLLFDLRRKASDFISKIETDNQINLMPYRRLIENKMKFYLVSILKYIYMGSIWPNDHFMSLLFDFVNHMLCVGSLDLGNECIGLTPAIPLIEQDIINKKKTKEFQMFLKANGVDYNIQATNFHGQKILCAKFKRKVVFLENIISSGTEFLKQFYSWSLMFDNVSFLYLDEFDAYYHYETAEFVFKELAKYKMMQALVTTHNTYLMNNSLVRPDVCFILSNNKIRCLPDCTDKEIREAHNLEKMYRNGAFLNE